MTISGPGRRTTGLIATAVVAVLTAAWWLQGGSGGDDTARDPSGTATPTVLASDSTSATPPSTTGTSGTTGTAGTAPDASPMPEVDAASGLPYVALADLPPEASDTVALIDEGGPFPYEQDGSTFGNYEGLLPDREDGYYREYTVETPGSPDRGARRIVGGAEGELYWTEDHYESFEVIWR